METALRQPIRIDWDGFVHINHPQFALRISFHKSHSLNVPNSNFHSLNIIEVTPVSMSKVYNISCGYV